MRGSTVHLALIAPLFLHASPEYTQVQQRLARGWNTWDVHSVTTQVLLPQGLAVRLGFLAKTRLDSEAFLPAALIGKQDKNAEHVFPGPHTFDGGYTDLTLAWKGRSFHIQSASDGNDLVLLITPLAATLENGPLPMTAVFSFGFLWNRPGTVAAVPGEIEARIADRRIPFFLDGSQTTTLDAPVTGYLFITAGSGITPVMAMLRTLKSRGHGADIAHIHTAPSADAVIFHDELRALEKAQPGYRLHLQLTETRGKVDFENLAGIVADWRERPAWVCGPPALLDTVEDIWKQAGLRDLLHTERFTIAATDKGGEGGKVTFAISDKSVEIDGATSIMEAGEQVGIQMPFGCRMGICQTCVLPAGVGARARCPVGTRAPRG